VIFSFFRYNTHGLLNVAAALFNITLGIVVLANNPRSSLQRAFFGFSLSSSLWVGFYGLMSLAQRDSDAALMLSFAFLGIPFIPAWLYRFSRLLLGKPRLNFFTVLSFAVGGLLSLLMLLDRNALCRIETFDWGRFNLFLETTFARVYFYALITAYVAFTWPAYVNFWRGWKTSMSPVDKRLFRNIFIAFSIGYMGMLDFGTAKGLNLYPTGYIALTALVAAIAYSVIRHQFFDMNMTLRRASLFALIYVFLIGFSVPVIFPLARHLLDHTLDGNVFLFLMLSLAFGVILSTGPFIYAYLERHTFWLKKHITTGLTHELKSPISAIRGAVDVLQLQLRSPSGSIVNLGDYVAMIDKNTLRLEGYVKDLLHIAKGQDGVASVQRADTDLVALVRQAVETHSPAAKAKDIDISIVAAKQVPMSIDAEKIQQTLSNLVSNAIKFSERGLVTIGVQKQARDCVISVHDEGCGIPAANLERIFDRFFQGSTATKGSGIGLTIAKAWVEAHGGKIWAESDGEGKGTTVTFTLPV
jgi:signal transduction histidine kinase